MPELPEVETIAQDLRNAKIEGKTIATTYVGFARTIHNQTPQEFNLALKGQTIKSITRRGKYLIFTLVSGSFFIVHLRMTGKFYLLTASRLPQKHEHVVLTFTDQTQLVYHDTRKFGRWVFTDALETFFQKLGPEPLEQSWNLSHFKKSLLVKKRLIKPLLLDQSFLAGLGNIYVDEALWEAQIHPQRLSSTLNDEEISKLFFAIQKVLKRGLATQGTTLGSGKTNYYRLDGSKGNHQTVLNVFRKTGQACPRCQHTIVRIVVGQRSTHVCPYCQKA